MASCYISAGVNVADLQPFVHTHKRPHKTSQNTVNQGLNGRFTDPADDLTLIDEIADFFQGQEHAGGRSPEKPFRRESVDASRYSGIGVCTSFLNDPAQIVSPVGFDHIVRVASRPAENPGPNAMTKGASSMVVSKFFFASLASTTTSGRRSFARRLSGSTATAM
jgi:hypothetical protein